MIATFIDKTKTKKLLGISLIRKHKSVFKLLENIYSICWFKIVALCANRICFAWEESLFLVFFFYIRQIVLMDDKIVFWVIKSQVCSFIVYKRSNKLVTINLPLKNEMLLLSCIHSVSVENHFSVDTCAQATYECSIFFFIDDKCVLYMLLYVK